MSRVIVKNLPKGVKEDRLKTLFSSQGNITDCSLKFTNDGVFRKFAFIGFQSEEEAKRAVQYFNKTFIDTSKIQVELAKSFGDKEKPRAWSKYSQESSAFKQKQANQSAELGAHDQLGAHDHDAQLEKKEKKTKEDPLDGMLGELKDDPGFEEFLELHKNASTKKAWSNDVLPTQQSKGEITKDIRTRVDQREEDSGNSSDEEIHQKPDSLVKEDEKAKSMMSKSDPIKMANQSGMSDLEYLKTKIGVTEKMEDLSSSSDEEERVESVKKGDKPGIKTDTDARSSSSSSSSEDEDEKSLKWGDKQNPISPTGKSTSKRKEKYLNLVKDKKDEEQNKEEGPPARKFTVKMRGFQGNVGETAIRDFFKPLKLNDIRIPRNAKRKPIGVAFVDLMTEKDLDQALRRNKNFIGGRRIFLKKSSMEGGEDESVKKPRPWEQKQQQQEGGEDEEGIAESGRLYVRNLAYISTEEDLEQLFSPYGPLTEVHLPIDKITRKIKGFAHITYMIPEHAVKAYTELDGSVFMGRMVHILPGKPKKEQEFEVTDNSSFKKQKAAKQKALAGSSHNWNTLFLGVNAVAEVMADKYGTTKSQILDAEASQSLGVRMALGETLVVSETRDFLSENRVQLDSFSQPSAPRSKTVILAKNLPAGTKTEELREVFSRHGSVGRVVLPPSGITAIIEFLERSEARTAFTRLAYTKFHHVPLYLEWAPMEVFKPSPPQEDKPAEADEQMEVTAEDKDKVDSSESEEEAEAGSVLFVKNLNFDTQEDRLRQVFESCGKLKSATIAKKKDMKNPGSFLSMGYGFVEYRRRAHAQQALKELQHTEIDGHQVELKVSNRATLQPQTSNRKKAGNLKQKSSKILVRNIPFEAKQHEILELFKVFGELKTVRLPKKLSGTGSHRGFGFVDFVSKQDSKRAFNALCHSTHLFGRRLVLEWAEAEENIDDLRKKTAEHFHDDSSRKKLKKSELMDKLSSDTGL